MNRVWLVALMAGCSNPSARVPTPDEPLTVCRGAGERSRGPFGKPFEFMERTVDPELRPLEVVLAKDRDLSELIERSLFEYDADGRLIEKQTDEDGDWKIDWVETFTYTDRGDVLTWSLFDRDGVERSWEVYFYGRFDRLYRVVRDTDGVEEVDELDEYDWDTDGRLLQRDTWNPDAGPLTRTVNEYLVPAPGMDRMERVDTDGDNIQDEGMLFKYDAQGLLARTEDHTGTVTDYVYGEEGRLLASLAVSSTTTTTYQAEYSPLGLTLWTRTDTDVDKDGMVDEQLTTEWDWECDGPEVLP